MPPTPRATHRPRLIREALGGGGGKDSGLTTRGSIISICLCVLVTLAASSAGPDDFPETLMRSTFKIQQSNTIGTSFLMATPDPEDPQRGHFVLVTAAHVLESMPGDTATLSLRIRRDESFSPLKYPIRIRDQGAPLWVAHPEADVAALRIGLPRSADYQLVSTQVFATDETIRKYEIRPGEDVLVLGFPYGRDSHPAGFPVLRSARIASYPLSPSAENATFLLDMEVLPGNSGGPVFMCERGRFYGGTIHMDRYLRTVLGVVSLEEIHPEHLETETSIEIRKHRLGLARVVHAGLVRELIDSLPPPD